MMAAVSLAKGVCTLWQEETLLDYTIEVKNKQFRVHKVVMASVSDYFKAMLTGGMVESQTDRVILHQLSSHSVSNMIQYIYTGQFDLTKTSTEELLGCAVYLQIPAAIEECTKLLLNKVNQQNCFAILATFRASAVEDGVNKITEYIKANIDDLMEVCRPDMSSEDFPCFMDFWQKSEWELFVCVLEWIAVDEDGFREQYLNNLLSRVRFALMTPDQLAAIKQIDVYTESDGSWLKLLVQAEVFHNLPTHRKVLDDSEQSRVRSDPVPICYTAAQTSSSVFYSLHKGKSWKKHEAQFAPSLYEGVTSLITVNNYLIVCDSHISEEENDAFIQGWHIFDPRNLAWSTMASMNIARDGFAMVHYKKHLYALGGCTESTLEVRTLSDVIERFNFDTNTWEIIATKLPVCLEDHGACVIGDCIYVAGGYSISDEQFSTRHDCLDMSTNTWQSKAPMSVGKGPSPVDVIQVMKLWGEEVLFIFDRKFKMHYYSPSADQWSVWKCLSDMDSDIVHSHCPFVLVDQKALFLHSFAYAMKENSNDSSYETKSVNEPDERNGCVKWTLGEKGGKITEVKLDDFPVDIGEEEEWNFLSHLLSISPQHLRRPKKISAGLRMHKV